MPGVRARYQMAVSVTIRAVPTILTETRYLAPGTCSCQGTLLKSKTFTADDL